MTNQNDGGSTNKGPYGLYTLIGFEVYITKMVSWPRWLKIFAKHLNSCVRSGMRLLNIIQKHYLVKDS